MSDVTADEAEAEVRGRASTGRQAPEASPPAGPEPGRGAEPGVQPCAEAPEGDALPDVPPAGVTGGHDPQYLPYAPLWTPVIERNLAMLLEWIVADMRGCLFAGRPLVGKSHFLLYAKRAIPPLLGGAVIQLWSFLGYACGSKEEVLRSLLLQSGCRAATARSPSVLLDRLINHLVSAAQSIGSRRVVLLIDELQELPPDMYPVLMSIVSGLQTYGLVPCCISMAQPEIQERIQDLHDQAKLQVIGRFFSQVKRFDALTIDEAIETIRNIDAPDAAFTAKWFPHLRDIGWSLDRLGPPLHASIDELRAQKGLAQQVLIPFNHLRPALKFMFRMLANVPECQEGLTKEHVLECLERTGYPQVMHHYIATEDEQ